VRGFQRKGYNSQRKTAAGSAAYSYGRASGTDHLLRPLKIFFFWDITPSSPFKINRRFGAIIAPIFRVVGFDTGFLLVVFYPEGGGNMFIRKIV
jgi:hypothetical protein